MQEDISSALSRALPETTPGQRQGLVLICSDRVREAASRLGTDVLPLLHVVRVHEHSHAARETKLLRTGDPELLRREETIAQQETYMFLRSCGGVDAADAIKAMKNLMDQQPNCYWIPIP